MGYLCVVLPSAMDRVKTLMTSQVGEAHLIAQLGENTTFLHAMVCVGNASEGLLRGIGVGGT